MSWRIATRRSGLARAQARLVADSLAAATGRPAELVPLSTTGDEHPDRAVQSFDAKGLFVDGVRAAVLDGRCHLAVHSYKDLPTAGAPPLVVAAVPRRADPRDALVTRDGHDLDALRQGSTVGTSSARRQALLAHARPDLDVRPLRGNLDTRLRRVAGGDLDAVVVALAGLHRLGGDLAGCTAVPLDHDRCLHAPAQGALALECRDDDGPTLEALRAVDDPDSHLGARTERLLLAELEGGCTAPIGAHARLVGDAGAAARLVLTGVLADPAGAEVLWAEETGDPERPEELAREVATALRAGAGAAILGRLRADDRERAFGAP